MSTLRTNTLQNAAGSKSVPVDTVISGSAKAWVNFNGTGTVAIRQAFNVTSITDNGTGDYTINFATAMPDGNFAALCSSGVGSAGVATAFAYATTSVRVRLAVSTTGFSADDTFYNVAIFR